MAALWARFCLLFKSKRARDLEQVRDFVIEAGRTHLSCALVEHFMICFARSATRWLFATPTVISDLGEQIRYSFHRVEFIGLSKCP